MSIIKNLWENTKIICGNHPDNPTPPEMIIKKTGKVLYYGCPTYSPKNSEHTCRNAITQVEYERMLEHIAKILSDAFDNFETRNLTNYEWQSKNKKINYKVLSHTNSELVIMVTNHDTIHGGKL